MRWCVIPLMMPPAQPIMIEAPQKTVPKAVPMTHKRKNKRKPRKNKTPHTRRTTTPKRIGSTKKMGLCIEKHFQATKEKKREGEERGGHCKQNQAERESSHAKKHQRSTKKQWVCVCVVFMRFSN